MKLEWSRSTRKSVNGDWNLWRVNGEDSIDLMGWVTPERVVTYRSPPINKGDDWPEKEGFTTIAEAKAWLVATITMEWSGA